MVQPNLVTITAGFTDFSTLLFLALVLLGVAGLTLDFRLDITGVGGEVFASRLCDTLVWHSYQSSELQYRILPFSPTRVYLLFEVSSYLQCFFLPDILNMVSIPNILLFSNNWLIWKRSIMVKFLLLSSFQWVFFILRPRKRTQERFIALVNVSIQISAGLGSWSEIGVQRY